MRRARKIEVLPNLVDLIGGDSKTIYLFFVDLCGSTQYKQDCITQGQPDINWIIRQYFFLQRCFDLVKKYKGTIVKTIGDELFAFFEFKTNPEAILKCGIEIIQSFDNVKAYQNKSKLEAKVSIDVGETFNGSIADIVRYDPIGTPVDRCARLNSQAQKNEIVFSDDFYKILVSRNSNEQFSLKYRYQTVEVNLKGLGITKFYRISI